jgi:fatty-acyl-CoA synthase
MTASDQLAESRHPAHEPEVLLDITIGELLRHTAAEVPDRLVLVEGAPDQDSRRTWTYAQLLESAEQIARALLARFEPGDRLAVWAPNCPEWMLLQQGASLAGLIVVTVNPAYKASELGYVLRQSGAAGIFFTDSYRGYDMAAAVEEARKHAPDLREAFSFSDFDAFTASGDPATELPQINPGDPALIQYTSGTTGFPKGALLHHRGIVNMSRFVTLRSGVKEGGVWVNAMPMFHIGGGVLTEIGTMTQRGTYVLLPHFDAALVLECIETYRGTITLLVPTMLIAVLDHAEAKARDLSSLRTVMSGASFVPADLVRRTKEQFGCDFTIVFGQTELHGVITQTHLDDSPEDQSQTTGRPLPQVEVKIVDPVTGERLPPGVQGEICARGYQTMLAYYEMPKETAAALKADGWLHMGDLGTMDERGFVRITGRLKDMIIRGGENIFPREIEDLLFTHPEVSEAVVVGLPHPTWGEQVGAIIRCKEGATRPTPAQLRSFCRETLAHYKTPAEWFFVDHYPVTASGKVQKFELLRLIKEGELLPTPVSDESGA